VHHARRAVRAKVARDKAPYAHGLGGIGQRALRLERERVAEAHKEVDALQGLLEGGGARGANVDRAQLNTLCLPLVQEWRRR
jgi:hypothetical protein